MELNELSPVKGSRKNKKRVGRGPGSGHGKTSGKGHKGQKARSGATIGADFEGGQMPLQRRLPKRGFTNPFKKVFDIINISDLSRYEAGSVIDHDMLKQMGLYKGAKNGIKLLGKGDIAYPVEIKVNMASKEAVKKIEAAGGKIEFIRP
ncbi:MAG: 50S ribosomal protein L15 [Deltaproteobacteria bacterium]|nr:50S ribosomal protein L15 [Deltaproteobacteria bacterium]